MAARALVLWMCVVSTLFFSRPCLAQSESPGDDSRDLSLSHRTPNTELAVWSSRSFGDGPFAGSVQNRGIFLAGFEYARLVSSVRRLSL